MSYGFYRVGSQVDPARARQRLAAAMMAEAKLLNSHALPVPAEDLRALRTEPVPLEDFEPGKPSIDRHAYRVAGYTGDECATCGSMRMKQSGTCKTCEECGNTTGCS